MGAFIICILYLNKAVKQKKRKHFLKIESEIKHINLYNLVE